MFFDNVFFVLCYYFMYDMVGFLWIDVVGIDEEEVVII